MIRSDCALKQVTSCFSENSLGLTNKKRRVQRTICYLRLFLKQTTSQKRRWNFFYHVIVLPASTQWAPSAGLRCWKIPNLYKLREILSSFLFGRKVIHSSICEPIQSFHQHYLLSIYHAEMNELWTCLEEVTLTGPTDTRACPLPVTRGSWSTGLLMLSQISAWFGEEFPGEIFPEVRIELTLGEWKRSSSFGEINEKEKRFQAAAKVHAKTQRWERGEPTEQEGKQSCSRRQWDAVECL